MAEIKPSHISVELKPPVGELRKMHAEVVKRLRSTEQLYASIAVLLDRFVQRNFKQEGALTHPGAGWKTLRAGGRWKGKTFDSSAKILQDTGRLRASFFPFHDKTSAGIGSDIPYSKPHEEGLNGLPERRMLPREKQVKEEVKKVYDYYVKQAFNAVSDLFGRFK